MNFKIYSIYNRIPSITVLETDWELTFWSVAKHAHHGFAFGLESTKYGMTQADLDSIANKGSINHMRDGGKPPYSWICRGLTNSLETFC